MKLRNIFVAITVTLVAIAIAAPAGAQIKCKAKQDKKTGAIAYSFLSKAGGTVVYSYSLASAGDDTALFGNFANEYTCQAGGKGRNCLVSNDPAEAAIAPANCKIYMADVASGDTCELYIKGCQVAQRPLPTTGYYAVNDGDSDPTLLSLWDADTGITWFWKGGNPVARSLDDHKAYLSDVVNGGTSDGVDYACLTDGCDLKLPTLSQLQKLGEDCAAVAVLDPGTGDWTYSSGFTLDQPHYLEALCTALWPDPSLGQPANCAWSRTILSAEEEAFLYAHAVCVVESGCGESNSLCAIGLLVASPISTPLRAAWNAGNGGEISGTYESGGNLSLAVGAGG
jgi:hypothetical protein